ncbi:MAG: BamA/TamA family outer membrane protein [Candidatus Eisenbacteria bacterium]
MRLRPTRVPFALAVAAVLAVLSGGLAGRASAQSGELPEELRTVAEVRWSGMHELGGRQLKAANLKTRRPSRLPWRDRPTLRRDYLVADSAAILGLYRHYGFLDATVRVRVEPTKDPRSARIVYEVREGARARIAAVELAGVSVTPENELRRGLLARPRAAFDPAFLHLDTLKIRTVYRERGYFPNVAASWRRGAPDSLQVTVRYAVDEGPQYRVGAIEYLGANRVREELGRRELLLKPGDVYDEQRLQRSIERMYQTSLFRAVQVSTPRDSAGNRVDLQLRVSERKPRWIDGGVGSGSTDRFRLAGEWGHGNLDTRALRGVVDGELAWDGRGRFTKSTTSATLSEPWLFGVRLLGQAGLFYRQLDDWADPRFHQRTFARGVNFLLYREVGRMGRVTLAQENAFVSQSYDALSDTLNVVLDSLAAAVVPRYRSNSARLTLERDTRNDRVAPSRGSYQSLAGEFAGGPLKGQSSYRKTVWTSTWYTPYRNGWSLASRFSAGMMGPTGDAPTNFSPAVGVDSLVARVPRESRFFVGGVNSLRGYGENTVPSDGGLAMLLGNLELRVPIAGPFGLEFFLDGGNVWARPEYVQAGDFRAVPGRRPATGSNSARYTYGVGARVILPFGPLRVDLAWSEHPDFPHASLFGRRVPFTYQFAIGPTF